MICILSDYRKIGGPYTWEKIMSSVHDVFYNIDDILKNNKYEIVYINNYVGNNYIHDVKMLKNNHIKIYFIMHSDINPTNTFFVNNIDVYDGVVCTNKRTYEKVVNLYKDKKLDIKILYNSLNSSDVIDIKGYSKIKNDDNYRIHFSGRLSAEKNLPMLFYAIKNINNVYDVNKISLHLYGTSTNKSYEQYLRKLCKDENVDNIYFEGHKDDKNEIYENADLVILPSVYEGLPYCLLEAKKYNKEILYNDISKISYHINDDNFTYVGYNMDIIDNKFIAKYDELLLMIGYVKYAITKYTPGKLINKIKYLCENKIAGHIVTIPPNLIESTDIVFKGNIFEDNVKLLENNILKKINKKLKIHHDENV